MKNSIQQVKTEHETSLMEISGVVSVGIGKDTSGEQVIIVGVEKNDAALQSRIPAELDGYPVLVQTLGSMRAQ